MFRATRETSIRKKHSKKTKHKAREHNKRHVESRNGLREEEKFPFTSENELGFFLPEGIESDGLESL